MKLTNVSLTGKIISLIIATVFIVGGTTFISAYYFLAKGYDEQAEKEVSITSHMIQVSFEDLKAKVKGSAVSFASRPDVIAAVEKKDTAYLQNVGKTLMANEGLGFVTIADKDGNVIARGHSDKTGDSVTGQSNVKKALAGEASVGVESGSVVKLSLRAGAPVRVDGRIVGTVTPGIDLPKDHAFVDTVKKGYGVECTIFDQDERITTTLQRNGKRIVGTKMDNPQVIETVLRNGQTFLNRNRIQGEDYNTAYWPIIGADGKVTGMFFIWKDRTAIAASLRNVVWAILISVAAVGLLMAGAGWVLARSTARPVFQATDFLNQASGEVTSAANQISQASQSLAEGASEQASSLEETSASIEEMASMTKQNAGNANQANALMAETTGVVDEASRSMGDLTEAMREISGASEETAKIIKTIDEIAFQTNLLALNAAVEAARAGEAGAGFAVVADEVRNLAMRAADAAKHTAQLIEETVKKINNGSGTVTRTNEAFAKVTLGAKKVKDLVSEISAASNEQAQGVEQINKAVSEMDKVIQKTAANAEESAAAAEELNSQAEQMKGFVRDLIQVVNGSGNGNGLAPVSREGYGAGIKSLRSLGHATPARPPEQGARKLLAARRGEKVINPEQVIPLEEDEDFKDF